MDDKRIIEMFFARDEGAILETQEKYGKLCLKIADNIIGDVHDADECVNEAYLGLWNAIPPERPKSLSAFLAKITRNLALKRLEYNRAAKRYAQSVSSIDELEEILPGDLEPSETEDRELGEWISAFLRQESEDARNVFIRKYWFFDPVVDISERYGFSPAKVKSMLFHTRNRLRKYLEEKGVRV